MLSPKEEFKKKRGPDGSPGVVQPPKKQYTGSAVEDKQDAETEIATDQVLLRFQKKAILVKLYEHKHEIQRLHGRISILDEKQSRSDHNLHVVNTVWNNLLQDLHLILGRIDSYASLQEVLPSSKELNGSNPSSFLQLLLETNTSDGTDVEAILQKKSDETKKILSSIVEAIEKERSQRENFFSELSKDASEAKLKILAEENEKLRKEQQQLRASVDELHIRHKGLNQSYNQLHENIVASEERIEKMKDEIMDARELMDSANRKAVKLEIKYKEEIEELRSQLAERSLGTVNNVPELVKPVPMQVEQKEVPQLEEMKKAVQAELEELKSLSESRQQTIEQYEKDRLDFVREIEKLQREMGSLPLERVVHSTSYQILQQQLSCALQDVDAYRQANDKLRTQLAESSRQFNTERDKIESAEQFRRDALEKELKAAESRASKYKSERDQARRELETAVKSAGQNYSLKEWKAIISSKDAELKKLKEQIEHLKEDSIKLQTIKEDNKKNQEKIYDVIDQKKLEIRELNSKIQEYVKTIDDYKQRRKKWEEKERELKIIIEVFQTQAKDRRDINEIKISERKLQEANALLELELAKYTSNKQSENREKDLEEHAEQLKTVKAEWSTKLAKAEKTIKDLNASIDKQKGENDSLLAEIEAIGKAFEDSQEQNTRLLQQLSEKEDTLTKLVADQIRAQQLQNSMKEERAALEDKIAKSQELIAKLEDVGTKYEQKVKLMDQQLKKQTEELRACAIHAEGLKRSARENSLYTGELKFTVERLEKEVNENKHLSEEKAVQIEKQRQINNKLSEELIALKRKLDKTAHGETDSLLEEEIKSLKHKLTCSVCNDRPKSAIIARCCHVFCRYCIQKNLEVRSRKCPGCAKPFAESDVHNIYL